MKETAVFINQSTENALSTAFDEHTRDLLGRTLNFLPDIITPDNMEEYREELRHTKYLFSTWGMLPMTEAQIGDVFPNLEAVFYAAGSVQHFARPFLNRGIRVFSAWAANAIPVAEYTVSQIVLANKGFFQGLRRQEKAGRNAFFEYSHSFPGSYRVKVGILGAGSIGSLVLKMLREYDMETYVYDPFASDEKLAQLGAKRAELEEIFSECQTISNHIANLPATKKMLRYEHFSRMKSNATFINTGRGAQIVEEDLIRALKEKPDRTALLDVTDPEPPERESDLWNMPNVFLTPHIAGSLNREIARMGAIIAQEYITLHCGGQPRYEVTLPMLETMA